MPTEEEGITTADLISLGSTLLHKLNYCEEWEPQGYITRPRKLELRRLQHFATLLSGSAGQLIIAVTSATDSEGVHALLVSQNVRGDAPEGRVVTLAPIEKTKGKVADILNKWDSRSLDNYKSDLVTIATTGLDPDHWVKQVQQTTCYVLRYCAERIRNRTTAGHKVWSHKPYGSGPAVIMKNWIIDHKGNLEGFPYTYDLTDGSLPLNSFELAFLILKQKKNKKGMVEVTAEVVVKLLDYIIEIDNFVERELAVGTEQILRLYDYLSGLRAIIKTGVLQRLLKDNQRLDCVLSAVKKTMPSQTDDDDGDHKDDEDDEESILISGEDNFEGEVIGYLSSYYAWLDAVLSSLEEVAHRNI